MLRGDASIVIQNLIPCSRLSSDDVPDFGVCRGTMETRRDQDASIFARDTGGCEASQQRR